MVGMDRRVPEPEWRARRDEHERRVDAWTLGHLARRERGEKHPVADFLFTYYSHRPAQLEQWHPGPGPVLRDADAFLAVPGHVRRADGTVALDPAALPDRHRTTAAFVHALLVATAARPPRLGCFGLHEWAMVYRTVQDGATPRHAAVPLRLGAAGTDAVIEALPVHCTHHDAYRFFTAAARPRNAVAPTRAGQVALEQPGCLHATMDLYKWAYKLAPATPGELLADCFALAADVRELDMRASPYDLSAYGFEPIAVETPAGRAEYVRLQQEVADRAVPLRAALSNRCELLLGAVRPG